MGARREPRVRTRYPPPCERRHGKRLGSLTTNCRESANEVLEEYFNRIGGRDAIFKQTATAAAGKKRGRKPSSANPTSVKRSRKSNGAHPGASTPPASSSKAWSPPAGSWEDDIESIDACQDEGVGQLMVYLVWKNGKKTRHQTSVIYKKCPQKVSFGRLRGPAPMTVMLRAC